MFLEFHDSFGKKEKVALDSPRQIPPLPKEIKFHRGVSYPFKDKNKLREPIK